MLLFDALSRWSRGGSAAGGWVGVYPVHARRIVAAYAHPGGRRPRIETAPVFDADDPAAVLLQWQGAHHRRARANVLFNAADYRIVPLETPPVPPAERRDALRWQLRDLIDFPADEACIDCIDVPGATLGADSRQVFAIASTPAKVRGWMVRYRDQRLQLGAIDIPELALRNLSVRAAGGDAHAYIHIGLKTTRLILVWQHELCSFRRFDVSATALDAADDLGRTDALERLALEIQRSTDAFSRLFHGADLRTVWVSALRDADSIAHQLAQVLPQTVHTLRIEDHVDLSGERYDVDTDYTFAIGAALRGMH